MLTGHGGDEFMKFADNEEVKRGLIHFRMRFR
jgi:glycosylphosphatidylinositol transamidase (GPIT) subunit GPI8